MFAPLAVLGEHRNGRGECLEERLDYNTHITRLSIPYAGYRPAFCRYGAHTVAIPLAYASSFGVPLNAQAGLVGRTPTLYLANP